MVVGEEVEEDWISTSFILFFSKQKMGFSANNIGKYKLGRTIGEGTFAKVKLAVDSTNGQYVAVKIIDKQMVLESNLKYQVNFDFFLCSLFLSPPLWKGFIVRSTLFSSSYFRCKEKYEQ